MLIRNLEQTNKLLAQDLKTSKRLPNDKKENIKKSIVVNQGLINYYKENLKNLKNNESVNEASPCWKGYKQVGMKDKGGRQVPNCVPNESVVTESSFKTSQLPTWLLLDDAIEFMEWYKDGMELKKGRIAPFNKADELSLFRLIKAWMQADDEYSKGVAHGGGVTGKRPNREQYKEKIEKFLLQKAKVANESVVNEEPAKSTGEKIQNLNNRIKDLKDDMMSTNSTKQKNLIQQKLKNALQTLSNYKKQNISKKSVSEGVSSADMDKIKGAVEAAKSFMNVGAELKKLGMKYTFATEPLAIYIIQPTPNNKVAIVNKKYVSKPDFVVGDIAVGVMESKSVTEASGRVPQIFLKTGAVEKKIKELMADRKKAVVPYNTEKDPAKKESLKQILIKLTKQIQGYEKNLVQLRDKEEEYIQQMQADVELDTSAFD